ncbi:assimilatory nitrite reductase (NAD(P)H) large subunit precursor [Novosphingobium nitrogenifigens DSM 19370]|uniref:Assimilatory nitrite reductase (NAD(P)H) large subunit n=1 Tax=Novosphingobium nitrogenifigens DSM 19370 TaxID=983920 RepID=F1Z351_9SPHN|nr:assimilatory nitrite reductase (NAD(P)H) large subunit precursor [Novosphingobium nitrogenifigens DSM 19370]
MRDGLGEQGTVNAHSSNEPADGLPTGRERLVVIGNGMAGCRAVEEILARDPARFNVTIFGSEPRVNYNRIMLSPVLAGEKSFDDIVINDAAWYADNGIELISGDPVVDIDRADRRVVSRSGKVVAYDRLLIATGSDPFIIPVPGHDLAGVVTFRDLDDVDKMLAAADRGGSAVVIGGGLLGLEAAHGLALRGMQVTVIHLMPTLMERQLDEAAGWLLRDELERRGQTIITGGDTAEIVGKQGHVAGVRLKDGRELPADIVVMAVGIRPSTTLARGAGLEVGRGVLVDDHMVTSDPAIMAVGECVEHRGQCYGLVAPLWDMARSLADAAVGRPGEGYQGSVTSTKLKVSGIDLFSAGDFSGGEGCEDIVLRDAARGIYKRVVVRDNCVIGAVLYGDTADGSWYFDLLKKAEDISPIRDTLILGQAFAMGGGNTDPCAAVAALSDDAEICGCNGVSKGQVVSCIDSGAHSLDAVRSQCKASASCGSCTSLVENLLRLRLGADMESGPKTMCKCTSFTHADVRRLIVERKLKVIPQVMQELGWKTPDGCASCRPALNYYLLCAWPGEYEDDQKSRFVNERLHANIQKDGTYSVVPRMWGGVTTPDELRAIADAADKFGARMVKVTGGQRIDLFGIRKEDLPAIWGDLNAAGMVSGHAYGKSLRTVKTCVGSEWCRFGTQDSTGLGITIEKMTWGSWMPHKFKIAVSGCPRNCAEATIKDFGVICVDSGYELHVGGNGGIHVRATELLCKVETEHEALAVCAAFIQLYREEAWYLERTAPWIERVGLDYVKQALFGTPDAIGALAARFHHSQLYSQKDPWAERAAGKFAELHQPLAQFRPLVTEKA